MSQFTFRFRLFVHEQLMLPKIWQFLKYFERFYQVIIQWDFLHCAFALLYPAKEGHQFRFPLRLILASGNFVIIVLKLFRSKTNYLFILLLFFFQFRQNIQFYAIVQYPHWVFLWIKI